VTYGKYKSTAEQPGRHSSIVLLDRHFCIIEIARQVFVDEMDRPNAVGWLAEDVRLLLYDNRILATVSGPHRGNWRGRGLVGSHVI